MSKAAHSHQLLFSNIFPTSPFNIPPSCWADGTAEEGTESCGSAGNEAGGGRSLDFLKNIPETSSGFLSGIQPGLGIKPLAIITPPFLEEVVHYPIFIVCNIAILVTDVIQNVFVDIFQVK